MGKVYLLVTSYTIFGKTCGVRGVLFAFDPKRQAILLVGGNKSGNIRWYKENIPITEQRYKKYLEMLNLHNN